jgi:hypothetical protein
MFRRARWVGKIADFHSARVLTDAAWCGKGSRHPSPAATEDLKCLMAETTTPETKQFRHQRGIVPTQSRPI